MFGNTLGMKLRGAYLSMHRTFQAHFARFGITADQFVVLSLLAAEDGLIQRELVRRTSSDANTITALLRLLERDGLIRRVRHENDGRARCVFLTERGRQLQRKLERSGRFPASAFASRRSPGRPACAALVAGADQHNNGTASTKDETTFRRHQPGDRLMSVTRCLAVLACALLLGLSGTPGALVAQERSKDAPPGAQVIRDLEYAKVGDVKLLLDLYLPTEGDGLFPVIVAIHGGGWAAGKKEEAQGIRQASRGYAVAAISYRLSGVATFPAQIEDGKAAVRWLRANAKKYNLDTERVGATGHTAGGHLVSLLGTSGGVKEFEKDENREFSSQVRAVCALSGPTDFLQMDAHAFKGARLKHDDARSPESRFIGGPIQDNKVKVAKANPITYVSKDSPPFLLIHGDEDPLVPVHQTQLLHDALKEKEVPVQLHIVIDAGHGVGGRDVNEAIDQFFDKHLKNAKEKGPPPKKGPDESKSPNSTTITPPVGLFVCRGPNPTPEKKSILPLSTAGWCVPVGIGWNQRKASTTGAASTRKSPSPSA